MWRRGTCSLLLAAVLVAGPLLVLVAGFDVALRLVEQKWFGALSRLVTLAVLAALLWPFWRALLFAPPEERGVVVDRAEFPRLWRLVDEAAEEAGVAAVSELRISDDAALAARCDGKWLGLRRGGWRLRLGTAAVCACPEDALRLAIAAELAGWRAPGARLRRVALPAGEVHAMLAEADLVGTSRWALGAFNRAVRPVVRGCVLAGDAAVARERGGGVLALACRRMAEVSARWDLFVRDVASWVPIEAGLPRAAGFAAYTRARAAAHAADPAEGSGAVPTWAQRATASCAGPLPRVADAPLPREHADALCARVDAALCGEPVPPERWLSAVRNGVSGWVRQRAADIAERAESAGVTPSPRELLAIRSGRLLMTCADITGLSRYAWSDQGPPPDDLPFDPEHLAISGLCVLAAAIALQDGRADVDVRWGMPPRVRTRTGAEFEFGAVRPVLTFARAPEALLAQWRAAGVDVDAVPRPPLFPPATPLRVAGGVSVSGRPADVVLYPSSLLVLPLPRWRPGWTRQGWWVLQRLAGHTATAREVLLAGRDGWQLRFADITGEVVLRLGGANVPTANGVVTIRQTLSGVDVNGAIEWTTHLVALHGLAVREAHREDPKDTGGCRARRSRRRW